MLQQRSLRLLSSLSQSLSQRSARPAATCVAASLRCRSQRPYSIHADASVGSTIKDIEPSKLSITTTTTPKALLPPEELIFGRNFSGASFGGVHAKLPNLSRPHALARVDCI
jgi:branched-chain amino acid aminotransferase